MRARKRSVRLTNNSGAVAASLSLSDNNQVLSLAPAANLQANAMYTVVLEGSADRSGNGLPSFTSSFQTGASDIADTTAPRVVASNPGQNAVGVVRDVVMQWRYDEPLDPLSVVAGQTILLEVSGAWESVPVQAWLDSGRTVLNVRSSGLLASNTTYRLYAYVTDVAGNGSDYWLNFTTGEGDEGVTRLPPFLWTLCT